MTGAATASRWATTSARRCCKWPTRPPTPLRVVAARRDVQALEAAMQELPPRQRAILAAARVDGLLNAEIADRFQISVAMVKKELGAAMRHCRARLADSDAVANGELVGRRKF